MAARSYPLGVRGEVVGTPFQGTHAKAFNVKGGSDNWQSENAYDIKVPVGTPVYAVSSGTIGEKTGPSGQSGRFAGSRLDLRSANNEFFYGHLSKIVVAAGDKVAAGQLLGYSGEADGVAHLHFAAKDGDPSAWLGARPQGGAPDASAAAAPAPSAVQPVAPVADVSGTQPVLPSVTTQAPSAGPPTPESTQAFQPSPGSGMYAASEGQTLADEWSRIASQPGSSPESQLLAQNAALMGG